MERPSHSREARPQLKGLIVRTSPSQLLLLTAMIGTGVLLTWTQAEAIMTWRPTAAVHAGMALVAAGAFFVILPPLARRPRRSS